MALATLNQNISSERKFGGSKKVIEGQPKVLVGGFEFVLDDLPDHGNVLPEATPVLADETSRIIKPTYTFAIAEAAEDAATEYKVKKDEGGTRVKAGMVLMVAPDTVDTVGTGVTVTKVDESNSGFDVITVSDTLGAAEVGKVLIEATEEGSAAKVKVVPNALLERDVRKDRDAKQVNATAIWFCDFPILERRIPPVPACLKKALADNGCFIRFSARK